jgi:hypothetical protein
VHGIIEYEFLSCLLKQVVHAEQGDNLTYGTQNKEHGLLPIYKKFVSKNKHEVNEHLMRQIIPVVFAEKKDTITTKLGYVVK